MKEPTPGILFALCCAQNGECFYCATPLKGKHHNGPTANDRWTRDHVQPSLGRPSSGRANNTVLACRACNLKKASRDPTFEEMARMIEVHERALRWYLAFYAALPEGWKL